MNNTNNKNTLQNKSTKVILNIVTGDKPSKLSGITEVSGTPADIIIVNPNGFVIQGAVFYNAKSVTLITGWGQAPYGKKPSRAIPVSINPMAEIIIRGCKNKNVETGNMSKNVGMDAGNASINLISKNIKINGNLLSDKNINIQASGGLAKRVRGNWEITGLATNITNEQSDIFISNHCKLSAPSVNLISYDAGYGIEINGQVLSTRGDITIESAGNVIIHNANITSKRDLKITAKKNLTID